MFLKRSIWLVAMTLVILSACESNSETKYAQDALPQAVQSAPEFDRRGMQDAAGANTGNAATESSAGASQSGAFQVSERKIIKTAHLRMEIRKYAAWNDDVLKKVQNAGGYIMSSSSEKYDENVMRGSMTIRVPQEKFSELLKTIKSTAKNLENETLGGQDVTEEFYDVTARLNNKRKTEARIQEILQAARSVEDILKVEEELSRVREEIERMEGRLKFLASQTSYSTISIDWHEPYPLGVSNGQGFWGKIGDGFKNGIEAFGNVLSGVIAFMIGGLPLFALIFIVGWIFLKILRKRKARNLHSGEIASERKPDADSL